MIDWNERYSEPGYAYGTQPNDFLREQVTNLPGGRVLSLAEGEGKYHTGTGAVVQCIARKE